MGAVYALICLVVVVVPSFALTQSLKEKEEGVSSVGNGETPHESELPIVVDFEHSNQLDVEVLVQSSTHETGSRETDGQREAGGEENVEGIEDNPVIKSNDERESTVVPPEQESLPEAEEQTSISEAVPSPESELRRSDVGEGETVEVKSKESEVQGEEVRDVGSQDPEGGSETVRDLVSPEENEGGGVVASQDERQLQAEEKEEEGEKEGVKGEEEKGEKEEEEEKESEKKDEEESEKEEEEGDLTFEEFKRRKMMEQEATQQMEESVASIPISKTKDNYASVDCGAKVIATNKQAQNPTAILIENKDVYMLNPCSAKIWFIVELCDMVSVQTLEIACLELFSSVPESFNVYSAESYPDPEWVHLGTFHAANKREVQSFPLATDQYVYAKYIKVEMLSHYGREHYCPLSLLRVLGASMIQVFQYSEEQKEQQAGQNQQVVIPASGKEELSLSEVKDEKLKEDGTLLNAAKDAVLSLLEQPLNLLGVNGFRKPEEEGEPDGDMSQRAAKSKEDTNSSDQGVAEQSMEEERNRSLSEEDSSSPANLPEVKSNVSESENKSTEQPSTPPEEPQGHPNTEPNQYLGPRDPHLPSQQREESKEYSIETQEDASHKPSPQDKDMENDTTTTQEGDLAVGKAEGGSPSGGSVGVNSEQQFQNGREESGEESGESSANGGDSDLKTQQQTAKGVSPVELSTPELSLAEEAQVLVEGEEMGAGDGEEGLGLGVGLDQGTRPAEEDKGGGRDDETWGTSCKETAEENVKPLGEATPGRMHALGPELFRGDREEETLSQNNQPLGPTSSELGEEGVVMGTDLSDPQDTLMAGGVQNGATATGTNGRLSREILEEGYVVDKKDSTNDMDKHNSTNVALVNVSQAEKGDDSNGTEDQLSVAKLDDDGNRLDTNASLNDTSDKGSLNDSLHSPSAGLEPGNVSLTLHNASCGGTNGACLPQPREKSVFVRLSNRIRDLEVNMSLFSSYLDQLSSSLKRNKNKTEDTQKTLDKRISALNESLQLLRQETEVGLAGLREVSTDLRQVAAAVQEMAAGLHSTQEEITGHYLLVSVIQVSAVTFALLAVCLWLTCKQQSLRNELRTLQSTVARLSTHDYINHVMKNHTHERCGCILQPSNHIQPANHLRPSNHIQPPNHLRPSNHIWRSDCLGSNTFHSCEESRRKLSSQSSLDDGGGGWESEPWHLVTRGHKKKAKLNKSHSS